MAQKRVLCYEPNWRKPTQFFLRLVDTKQVQSIEQCPEIWTEDTFLRRIPKAVQEVEEFIMDIKPSLYDGKDTYYLMFHNVTIVTKGIIKIMKVIPNKYTLSSVSLNQE